MKITDRDKIEKKEASWYKGNGRKNSFPCIRNDGKEFLKDPFLPDLRNHR